MYVQRDFLKTIRESSNLEALLLWGPRQVGKTTLLNQLQLKSNLFLDDLSLRQRAQLDPALTLDDLKLPCLIDEVQYAPNLFPEIKLRIDRERRKNLQKNKTIPTQFYLTGSNKTLLDEKVKESLAGRCNLYTLHGLSVREILNHDAKIKINSILFRGALPELYVREKISSVKYLNDYIISFIEKDIAQSFGILKISEFQTVLMLLAARTGQFLNVNEVAGAAGVDQKTVQLWINLLQKNMIVKMLEPYSSNLSKRIVKMKKLFFYDVGICARLQNHLDENLLWSSPQAGSLFETLVFAEIVKTHDNFLKNWQLSTWRTKAQAEIDFVLQNKERVIFIEAKLGIHGAKSFPLDVEAKKVFGNSARKIVVTVGGDKLELGDSTTRVPIQQLGDYLLEQL